MSPPEKWRQVYEDLAAGIRSGQYAPGEALPGVIRIQAQWTVSNSTAVRALRELVASGLAVSVAGRGTYAAQDLPGEDAAPSLADRVAELERRMDAHEQGHA